MKKTLLILFIIFFVIFSILFTMLINAQASGKDIQKFNSEYEYYLNREIYGADLITVINKAINNNERYKIGKDANGLYITDNKNCLKVEVKLLLSDKIYDMEVINKLGIEKFIQNYNLEKFKCTKIEYYKQTLKVSKIFFDEINETISTKE